ncbi:GxGYxYP domain-containing protein [Kribbella pratensis]|uniref:GxGYxY motif-containing protein n=1 Tax=Kribbella pratensis TaxID=2512112 RepID=A0A4V3GE63_9ACTN|nr:GxGYxYP domain-containing protein [Kribbella pratensis]TDW54793.1 GxGYxY motif-containing protein [Kribbella pratensis]
MSDRFALSRRRLLGITAAVGVGAAVSPSLSSVAPSLAFGSSVASAYPKGRRPRVLNVLIEDSLSSAERTLATTLQGLMARRGGESLYLNLPTLGYQHWLDGLVSQYGVRTRTEDLWKTVGRSGVRGYVLFRTGTPSVNVATTLAGVTGAVAIEESLEALAIQHGLHKVLDVRDKDDRWVFETYWPRLRHDVVVEQRADFPERLRDYVTMAGTLAFFDGNSDFRAQVVSALDDDGTVIGWGDASNGEDAFIGVNSSTGVKALPADHARNLSVLSGIQEDHLQQQGRAFDPALRPATSTAQPTNGPQSGGGGGRALEPAPDPNAHYVSFLITDGDNIQWALGDFPTDPRWFGSPRRGEVDLGWGISPSLIDLAPSVMRWFYEQSKKDRWVVGPSGGGYMYPSRYPTAALEKHTASLAKAMGRADLSVAQIIDFDAFENTRLWSSYLKRREIDGLIYLEYSRYDGLKGKVVWSEGKPVISARTMLWDGLDGADEASVTAELNAATRNPHSTAGYSIVVWHAWSKSVDNVLSVVNNLAPHVKVIPPDTLVRMVGKYAKP